MRHLFLTIFAIAALQTGFQLFVVDEYAPEHAAAVASNAWPADTIVAVRGDHNTKADTAARSVTLLAKHRPAGTRRDRPVRAAIRTFKPRIQPTLLAKTTPPKRMPSTRVPRADGPDRRPDDGGDGKPWIAKALPIIKKPYSWLKALGAKLN
jgi:hypothetical protein